MPRMSTGRIVARVIIILGMAVLGASVGVCYQSLRITGKPQEFRSIAKITSAPGKLGNIGDEPAAIAGHNATIIEVLESAEMKRRALERVRALHPEIKETDLETRAAHTKGSFIINILVTGREPKFTRIYLDALLDEFMAWRHEMRSRFQGNSPNRDEDVAILERATPASEHVEDWVMPVTVGAIGGGLLGALVGLLIALLLVRQPRAA